MSPRPVAAEGLAAYFILALLGTAGIYYVNIVPAMVSGLVDGLHFSAAQAGRVVSCNVYGAAAGAFAAVLLVRRLPWRAAATTLLVGLATIDLASTLVHAAEALMALRTLQGFLGGLLVGVSYGVFARLRAPDRCFGALLFVQATLGGLGDLWLPGLVQTLGAPVLFLALAAVDLGALVLLAWLPAYPRTDPPQPAAAAVRGARGLALGAALAAVFLFQVGNMAPAAYVIEIGRAGALSLAFISNTLGVSNACGAIGAALVMAVGTRFGRLLPVGLGCSAAALATTAFHGSAIPGLFVTANVATMVLWSAVVPYLLGLCAAFDRSGRAAAMGGLASKLGLATGPYAASFLIVGASGYGRVIDGAVAALLGCTLCALYAARAADRRAPGPAPG